MEAVKDKIGFIAAARSIGILLVVFGHSFPFDVYIPLPLSKTVDFIYAFHMPLFIFLSGYLVTRNTRSVSDYIHRRGIRLLLPYFVLSVAAYIPKALIQQFLNDSVELSVWFLFKTELIPRENVWGHFWYIPVVFFLSCFGALMQKPMHKHRAVRWTALAVSYLLLFVPQFTNWFALEDLRKTVFYFILGMAMADWDPEARIMSQRYWILAFPAAIALSEAVDTTLADSVIACLMIGFVLHFGIRFPLDKNSIFAVIEKYSYSFFLLSWPAQAVVEVVCNKLLHLPVLLTMALMFLAGIAVPLICVYIVSRLEKRFSMKWVKLIIGM